MPFLLYKCLVFLLLFAFYFTLPVLESNVFAQTSPCRGAIAGRIMDEQGKFWGKQACENYPYSPNIALNFSGGQAYLHGCSGGPYYWTDEVSCDEQTITLSPPPGYRCTNWSLTYPDTGLASREGAGCSAKIAVVSGNPVNDGQWNQLYTALHFKIAPIISPPSDLVLPNWHCQFDEIYTCGSNLTTQTTAGTTFVPGKSGQGVLIDSQDQLIFSATNPINVQKGQLSFWVKPNWDGNDNQRHILFSLQTDSNNYFLIDKDEANKLRFAIVSPPGHLPSYQWTPEKSWKSIEGDISNWKKDEWHQLQVSWDTQKKNYFLDDTRHYGDLKAYVDGKLQGIVAPIWDFTAFPVSFNLGNFHDFGVAEAVFDDLVFNTDTSTDTPDNICGNSICEQGENVNICSQDCNQYSLPPTSIKPKPTTTDVGVFVMPGWEDMRDDGLFPNFESIEKRWWLRNVGSVPLLEQQNAHQLPIQSLLGWYDDSSSVTWDWQIKWGREHGINLYIFDWFYENGTPYFHDTLEKGFMQSRFFGEAQFAVMWTNGYGNRAMDYLDDRVFEEMTDYLLEHYFSQENYYKIDGKPVLFIWSPVRWLYNAGSAQRASQTIQLMINKAQQQGFPGLYLVGLRTAEARRQLQTPTWPYTSFTTAYEEMGFDAITDYGSNDYDPINENQTQLGNFVVRYEPYAQLKEPTRQYYQIIQQEIQQAGSSLTYFPAVSAGWDDTVRRGWQNTSVRTFNTPDLFRQMLQNAKDFLATNEIQPQLLTISALSEHEEGGVLQPRQDQGFAYLEAVANVFVNCAGTTDLNCDNTINLLDLLHWRALFAQNKPEADANGDGQKNILDYLVVLREWLKD